jgi:hypothetical protein
MVVFQPFLKACSVPLIEHGHWNLYRSANPAFEEGVRPKSVNCGRHKSSCLSLKSSKVALLSTAEWLSISKSPTLTYLFVIALVASSLVTWASAAVGI